jgi:hypothetical protein
MKTSPKSNTSSQNSTTTKSISQPQFVREEAFARKKAAKSKWSARDVLKEALRERGHCAHVEHPSPPIFHHGVDASQLLSWLDELEEKSRSKRVGTKKGQRRQRSDTPILMCVVVSRSEHPRKRNDPDCVDWRARTIAWIRKRYGDDHICCIIEHEDEGHQHLHVVLHNNGASVKPMMAGEIAVAQARLDGVSKSQFGNVYKAGCRELLDAYWRDVGIGCGLARQSNSPRPRVPRQRHIEARERELTATQDAASRTLAAVEEQKAELASRIAKVRHIGELLAPSALIARELDLAKREREVVERDARVQALTEELAAKLRTATEFLKLLTPEEREDLRNRVAKRPRL